MHIYVDSSELSALKKKKHRNLRKKVVRVNGKELENGYMEDGFDQYVLYTCKKYSKNKRNKKIGIYFNLTLQDMEHLEHFKELIDI